MTPEARPDDGWLEVCAFRNLTVLRMLYLAGACHLKRFSTRNGVLYARGREVVFESAGNEPVPLQVDGDPAGNLPARFSIKKRALEIIAPNH